MNVLVLSPGYRTLRYALIPDGRDASFAEREVGNLPGILASKAATLRALNGILDKCRESSSAGIGGIAVRALFGGAEFRGPALVTPATQARLAGISAQSPLHTSSLRPLVEACDEVFAGPVALAFETAFFADLPEQERSYGVEPELTARLELRRFGYHGLFHEAACADTARELLRKRSLASPRILSVCLEPKPEVAAVVGRRAVMVTSGATPIEGIPGETVSGELDPRIVLTLADELKWGPEQVNATLTQESGLLGLCGCRVTVGEALMSDGPELELAREVLRYRLLLAAGAGMAAMGGVDAIVFSGRYADAGERLGPWLAERLSFAAPASPAGWSCFRKPLLRVVADAVRPLLEREAVMAT